MQGSKRCYVRMRRLYLIIQAQARMDSLQILCDYVRGRQTTMLFQTPSRLLKYYPHAKEIGAYIEGKSLYGISLSSNSMYLIPRCIIDVFNSTLLFGMGESYDLLGCKLVDFPPERIRILLGEKRSCLMTKETLFHDLSFDPKKLGLIHWSYDTLTP